MQILHISDTHLGCIPFNIKEREEDVYEAFNEAVETAIKDRVDAVIHSGDILHTPKPSGTAINKLGEAVKRLNEHGIRFFFTLGEHDISRVRDTPSPYLFHRLGMATYIGDGRPYMHEDTLLIGFHKYRRSECNELVERLKAISPPHDVKKKVLVLHQGLGEFHPYAYELSMSDLPSGFNYYAMGHLHDHAMKSYGDGIICYPGSIDPTPNEGIREFSKGFCMVDLSGDEAKVDFIQIRSSRRHMHYTIEYERLDEFIRMVSASIAGLTKKPVIGIRIKGRDGVDRTRIAGILSKISDLCLHYSWEVDLVKGNGSLSLYESRPDIDKVLLESAAGALEDYDTARFAVDELLPLLNVNDVDGVIDLVWRRFEDDVKRHSR
ncbi:MAG: DNA repair exonuclease [Candidatus Nitrosocaldus sp.]